MKKSVLLYLALSGCTGLGPVTTSGADGVERQFVWFNANPLCLIFCYTNTATSGVKTQAVSGGDLTTGSNSNSQSQTASTKGE